MKTLFSLFCVLLGLQVAFAQSAGNYLYHSNSDSHLGSPAERATATVNVPSGNSLMLKAEVMMNVRPTSYTAIFSISQSGASAREVDSLLNDRIAHVRRGLAVWGISDEDLHIDAVSVVPIYETRVERKKFSTHYSEVPIGFEMKKNIHVLFRDHKLLDPIISEMAFVEVYDMVKIEYNIDGTLTYHEELRKAALDVIRSKEQSYTNFGMHLTITSMGEGNTTAYPQERYQEYMPVNQGGSLHAVNMFWNQFAPQSIDFTGREKSKLDESVSASLGTQYQSYRTQQTKTIFYDRIPYNQFDKVINADTEEPCIQIYYTLQVYYTIYNEEQWKAMEAQKQTNAEAMTHKRRGKRK